MNRNALLAFFLLSAGFASAGVITAQSGSFVVGYGENPYGTFTLDAPGFHLQDSYQGAVATPTQLSPRFCTGSCTFNFSGAFSSSIYSSPSLTYNGTTYSRNTQDIVLFSLNITGNPSPALANCTDVGTQFATCVTNWAANPFTFTGSVTVKDMITGATLVNETLVGGGSASGYSYYQTVQGPWNYTQATYAFATPEPGAGALVIVGGTLAIALRARRCRINKPPA